MRSKKIVSLMTAVVLMLSGGLAGTASTATASGKPEAASLGKAKRSNKVYIVRMADDPVVAYDGRIKGYAATKPKKGQKIDPDNPNVAKYFGYLSGKHDSALQRIGGANKHYSYGYVFNGFAAELSEAQVAQLKSMVGVLSVEKDEVRALETATTPHFLGLDAPGGLWERVGGIGRAGEDVIIGIVDSGVWPEHPSLSDRTGYNGNNKKDGKLSYQQIPGWHGKCTPGEAFNASHCSQKIIGARYYNSGWGGNAGIDALWDFEFNSPRDWAGHGTHTSTTAGGNANVTITGTPAPLGTVSGIAPRARIASYKVCWADSEHDGGCWSSDSVAAIDQAVADGVDVINFSISGSRTNFLDSVEVAFLFAADAGVFVAVSAGNNGPGSSTVAHPGPWLTSTAAGTHDRYYEADAVLGNGTSYRGASVNQGGVASSPLILSSAAGLAGSDPTEVALCYPGTLDPAVVTGKIVVCDRGIIDRVAKSLAVHMAGGVGMIHTNVVSGTLNADFHSVPTVHVSNTVRAAIHAYAATPGATASIAPSFFSPVAAPFTAGFSSRGPLRAGDGDLLKPDVMAPGVDIMAGVAPPGNGGELFASYQGTSMASPHVAGLAALLKNLHPTWSPMMIKSALMTTGYDMLDSVSMATRIFRQGAGFVDPNKAADPGLVFNHGFIDWLGFLCGTGQLQASYCPALGFDPSNLNVPSIAIGAMIGSQTVSRTVTNVGNAAETYTASVNMPGFTVTLPGPFTVARGESHTFDASFLKNTAAFGAYGGGQLTLTGNGGHVVRIPIVVRPISLMAPAGVSGTGGDIDYDVTFGYTGPFSATPRGLIPATTFEGPVEEGAYRLYPVSVPSGTTYARFSLFDTHVTPGSDLDLQVYDSAFNLIGSSGGVTSAEEINFVNLPAGTYYVVVWYYSAPTASADFTLFTWILGSADNGNMTVSAPTSGTLGAVGSISLSFSGLTPGTKYLGSVAYGGEAGMPNPTIVRVDP